MNLKKQLLIYTSILLLHSCADYKIAEHKEKKYYSSSGFALIYDDTLYANKTINKKLNNEKNQVMHNLLRTNTQIKIINPDNSKFVETKISKTAKYPAIFNIVITREIANILKLDINNPYVELFEIKKNKKFIAKESNTFDEEKQVAEKAPVDDIEMKNLSGDTSTSEIKIKIQNNFTLVISDFYYIDSANNLKNELNKKIGSSNFYVKKINNKKYRLYAGPFKNFNALKAIYISLNNLGFEGLNIYKE